MSKQLLKNAFLMAMVSTISAVPVKECKEICFCESPVSNTTETASITDIDMLDKRGNACSTLFCIPCKTKTTANRPPAEDSTRSRVDGGDVPVDRPLPDEAFITNHIQIDDSDDDSIYVIIEVDEEDEEDSQDGGLDQILEGIQ